MTGAYALIRFNDSLGDQRVNIGLIVWHPQEGFKLETSGQLSMRAKAIDPRAKVADLQVAIDAIRKRLESRTDVGLEVIRELSADFTKTVQVTTPYPVRISSLNSVIQRLYQSVIRPTPAIYRASTQRSIETNVGRRIAAAAKDLDWSYEHIGKRQINGVAVEVGMRTTRRSVPSLLWHTLSLKSEKRRQNQIALCKALVTDVSEIRHNLPDFRRDRHVVVLERPRLEFADSLDESIAWLRHGTERIIDIPDVRSSVVDDEIQKYLSGGWQKGATAAGAG